MVTMILMIIISLIVVGFARLVRREQRQSLDDQLSTQAFYAAETGINDAIKAMQANKITGNKTNCTNAVDGINYKINEATGVSYTCLLIDRSPDNLQYTIKQNEQTLIPIKAESGNIDNIALSWQNSTIPPSPSFTGCPAIIGQFPANGAWVNCDAGVLRVDLVQAGSFTRDYLTTNTLTAFLKPRNVSGAESLTFPPAAKGVIKGAGCSSGNTPLRCNFNISGLTASNYYLRIRAIYKDIDLIVTPTDNGGHSVSLTGAQAVIDSTGKAGDVLRRVVARVSIGKSLGDNTPVFAIQSRDTICKKLQVGSGFANVDPTYSSVASCQIN